MLLANLAKQLTFQNKNDSILKMPNGKTETRLPHQQLVRADAAASLSPSDYLFRFLIDGAGVVLAGVVRSRVPEDSKLSPYNPAIKLHLIFWCDNLIFNYVASGSAAKDL
ncbi:MAG: hypothetical protein IT260_07535 [Saprospiraceae bacterium]|nr:hypothetical protein [Saprospiraceae bacterium]